MNKFSIMIVAMSMVGLANANNNSSHSNSWTGFYAGVDTGVVFNNTELRSQQLAFTNPSERCDTTSNFSSFFPGVHLGYMHQFPHYFVSGIEANVSFNTNQNNKLSCQCPDNPNVSDRFSFKNQMQSSIKGRGGPALNWNKNILLPYVTTGASFAHTGLSYKNEGGDLYAKSTTQTGWLIGGGIEWSFKHNWSLRAEYSHVDYGNMTKLKIPSVYGLVDPNGQAHIDLNTNNILVAISYWI